MKWLTIEQAIAELGLAIAPDELKDLTANANLEELQKLGLAMDGDRYSKSEPCLARLPFNKKKAKKVKEAEEVEKVEGDKPEPIPLVNPYKIDWSAASLVISLTPTNGKTLVAIGVSGLPPLILELAETLPDLQELVKRAKLQAVKRQIQWNLQQKKEPNDNH